MELPAPQHREISPTEDVRAAKQRLRGEALARRAALTDKEARSDRIWQRVFAQPEWEAARTVMVYVSLPGEVDTRPFLPRLWHEGKQVVVPFCQRQELGLFRLEHLDELAPQTLGILEPRPDLRAVSARRIGPAALDLVLVPGVAFDRNGGRLGHGKGYYDRLLARLRPDALCLAMAFECQVLPEVPVLPHDVRMDRVLTEDSQYTRPSGPRQ